MEKNKIKKTLGNIKNSLVKSLSDRKRIMPKIMSVVVAFCIWFYVVSVESPVVEKEIKDIPVKIELPEEGDFEIFSGKNETVDITVKGKRSSLRLLSPDDFDAVLNLSDYSDSGIYNISVDIFSPESATVVEQSVSKIKVFLDRNMQKNLEVGVDLKGKGGTRTDIEFEKIASPAELQVSGPKSIVSTVKTASVEFDCRGKVESELHDYLTVVLKDSKNNSVESPYLELSETDVYVTVAPYLTKTVELALNVNGLAEEDYIPELSKETVELRGPLEMMNEYELIGIDADFSDFEMNGTKSDSRTYELDIPDEFEIVGDGSKEIEVSFEINEDKKTFSGLEVDVIPKDGMDCAVYDTVDITVVGRKSLINKFTADDIKTVEADFTKNDIVDGRIAVSVEFSQNFSSLRLEEEYTVRAYMTQKASHTVSENE